MTVVGFPYSSRPGIIPDGPSIRMCPSTTADGYSSSLRITPGQPVVAFRGLCVICALESKGIPGVHGVKKQSRTDANSELGKPTTAYKLQPSASKPKRDGLELSI
jgi:hypothetical protein